MVLLSSLSPITAGSLRDPIPPLWCARGSLASSSSHCMPLAPAGIAAILLSAEPHLSAAELRQRLLHLATKNVISTAWFPEEQRLQTPSSIVGLPAQLGPGEGWGMAVPEAAGPALTPLTPLQTRSCCAARCGRHAQGPPGTPRLWLAVPAPRSCWAAPASHTVAGGWASTWR